jgi:hypothetical protein
MYWAISNLVDGQEPSYRSVKPDWPLNPGEVLVNEDPTGKVWDATNGKLRPRTAAEILAEVKGRKKSEMEHRGTGEMQNLLPVYRALLLLAKNSADPRFSNLRSLDDKITKKVGEVDAATTVEAVNAIRWEV